MAITRLKIENFRCIKTLNIEIDKNSQTISGDNGTGKTSILEAIFFVSLGRSFRCNKMDDAIHHNEEQLLVYIETNEPLFSPIAGMKSKSEPVQFKINAENICSVAQLAQALPVQLLSANTLDLFTSQPKARRAFIDRGCFYFFEKNFNQPRLYYAKAMQQRNNLLRSTASATNEAEILAFEKVMAENGEIITEMRVEWLEMFSLMLAEQLQMPQTASIKKIINEDIHIKLMQGWTEGKSLQEALSQSREKDKVIGFTSKGPHTAEVMFTTGNNQAIKLNSSGEQKTIAALFLLIQAMMLSETSPVPATLLIDDLTSELDTHNAQTLSNFITKSGLQAIYTSISPDTHLIPSSSKPITLA